jgi:hypothetical protein
MRYRWPELVTAKSIIVERGWSYAWVARKINRSPMYMRRVLLGQDPPTAPLMGDLAAFLNVDEALLWPRVDEQVPA